MAKLTIDLDDDTARKLEALRFGRSLQAVVIEALAHYLEQDGRAADQNPVAASWATFGAPRALVESILAEDSLLES